MSRSYPLLMLGIAEAAAFVIIASFAFGSGTSESIALGVSIGTLVAATGAQLLVPSARRLAHRATAGAIGAVSAWSILVAAGIFSGDTQFWLIVAGAVASSTLALGAAVEDVVRERAAKRRLVGVPSAQAA